MGLNKFLVAYRLDNNYWWTLSTGDMRNLFDEAVERMVAAEAQLAAVRQELEQARGYVDDALGNINPDAPLVDRIVRLVSMLAAAGSATSAELDAVVDSATVDALVRRVDALEASIGALRFPSFTAQQPAHLINEPRL
jgi:hypothetical protein